MALINTDIACMNINMENILTEIYCEIYIAQSWTPTVLADLKLEHQYGANLNGENEL